MNQREGTLLDNLGDYVYYFTLSIISFIEESNTSFASIRVLMATHGLQSLEFEQDTSGIGSKLLT
jgi:hypothetical protein